MSAQNLSENLSGCQEFQIFQVAKGFDCCNISAKGCEVFHIFQVAKGQKEMAALQLMVATYRYFSSHNFISSYHIIL